MIYPSVPYTIYGYALQPSEVDKIRAIVREEIHKALHPEEERPSTTVELVQDGKTWRGTVYLVEDEEEDEDA